MIAGSSDVPYFAFGANMAREVLLRRRVRPIASCAARLDGYELRFNLPGIPFYEPGFANVECKDGSTVWGVLHTVTATDFERLAVSEGDGDHYCAMRVEVITDVGTVSAKAFQALQTDESLRPSKRYLKLLSDGARDHGLPTNYVDMLVGTPYVDPPLGEVLMPRVLELFEWMFQHGIAPNALIRSAWKVRHLIRTWRKRG